MTDYRIAVFPRDGVGPEVSAEAAAVLADGRIRTRDIGGTNSTSEVGEAMRGRLGR
jgi:isocitrate/isopropylmalate dehydrogenase